MDGKDYEHQLVKIAGVANNVIKCMIR